MNFSQKDPKWSGLPLGTSPYRMGPSGCLTTAHGQAFRLAGYDETPGTVVTGFNRVNAYTDTQYVAGPGLLLWNKVKDAFPQYHWHNDGSARYKFVQVIATYDSGRFEHWVLEVDGVTYDPLDGTTGFKTNYRKTGRVCSADIDQAPSVQVPVPAEGTAVTFERQMTVKVTGTDGKTLSCRTEATSAKGDETVFKRLPEGNAYFVKGYVHGENVNGNDKWYVTANGHYISAYFTTNPY